MNNTVHLLQLHLVLEDKSARSDNFIGVFLTEDLAKEYISNLLTADTDNKTYYKLGNRWFDSFSIEELPINPV